MEEQNSVIPTKELSPVSLTPVTPVIDEESSSSTSPSNTLQTKQYQETVKFNLFVQYYTEPGHTIYIKGVEKKTQFHATRSAIKAYDLDPERQYAHAMSWGSECLRKSKFLARDWMEEKGFNFNYMMAFAVKMMQESGQQGWWDRLMTLTKYLELEKEKEEKVGNTLNVFNLGDTQVQDFNQQFLKFIETMKTEGG